MSKRRNTSESTGPHQVHLETWIACAPFERLLKMTILEAAEGKATLSMPFLAEMAQGSGLLHGGALVALADTAVVMAVKSVVPAGTRFATVSLETKFLRPVKQGTVTAKAQITSREGKILKGQATVYDETGRAVVEFRSTCKIADDPAVR